MELKQCIYVAIRGKKERCTKDSLSNSDYCKSCIKKKNVQKILSKEEKSPTIISDKTKELTKKQIILCLGNHINNYVSNKKFMPDSRGLIMPEMLSENITKFIINDIEKIQCICRTDKGDLIKMIGDIIIKIEVKCFTSAGPSSFGPNENFDELYFLNATEFKDYKFKLYRVKLSNKNEIFKNIKISQKETFREQCVSGRRPRITFNNMRKQIEPYTNLIYDGDIRELFNENKEENENYTEISNWLEIYEKIKGNLEEKEIASIQLGIDNIRKRLSNYQELK